MRLKINRAQIYSSGVMILIGVMTVVGSLAYDLGTLWRMGPGYFPLLLGGALIIVAVCMLVQPSDPDEKPKKSKGEPQFRAWAFVVVGVVLFMVLGKYGGLVPATFVLVTLSALGDRSNSLRASALLGAMITILAVAIFHFGLNMQFQLFTWG